MTDSIRTLEHQALTHAYHGDLNEIPEAPLTSTTKIQLEAAYIEYEKAYDDHVRGDEIARSHRRLDRALKVYEAAEAKYWEDYDADLVKETTT